MTEARCPLHPEHPALGSCQRCGTFFCASDRRDVDGVAYCSACGGRPDVDWIEAYRQSLLGRRDSWAWFVGLSSTGYLVIAASLIINAEGYLRLLAIPALASAVSGALYFLGVPVARVLLAVTAAFWAVVQYALLGPLSLISAVISAVVIGAALTSTRSKLFFRLDVPRAKLKRDYDRLADNRLARNAFALGILSLLIPVIAPLAVVMGAIAARRVDPSARPPVGKRGHAIGGIVFGTLGCMVGAAVIWAYVAR